MKPKIMVGLGQTHDYWNMMYEDMKAIYTLYDNETGGARMT